MRERIGKVVIVGFFTRLQCEIFHYDDLAVAQIRDCSKASLSFPLIECADGTKKADQGGKNTVSERMSGDNDASTGLRKKSECGKGVAQFRLIPGINTNENALST